MPDAPRYRRSDPENESSAEIQAKLAELRKVFVGQCVKITDRGNEFEEEITGECSGFVVKTDGSFDILIKRSGFTDSRYGFFPERITDNYAQGPTYGNIIRKIELSEE